ncbi:spag1 axonemal dynein assembly factor [Haematobia irritans]|uniref:spag1 axonemal dynein assembly factor n=1 Tax=Haematobia irritans TaxID=7368 RepID=UPI003F501EB9
MNTTKKSLLERYGIPVNHLDFQYIGQCRDAKEMEKIVHILRSGEEGYYPDLTKCAEDKLRELKPQSRLFRLEEAIRGHEALPPEEWKPIYAWNHDIKSKDKKLQKLSQDTVIENQLPPVRKNAHISMGKKGTATSGSNVADNETESKKSERIKSTDYGKWDKYDAEEEILRIELAEERIKEEVERKNFLNTQKYGKSTSTPKIEEILEESEKEKDMLGNLSEIEKEKLSEEYRLRGNEFFRAKEYDNALAEYTKAIQVYPEKAVGPYNNRAVTYFKQKKFYEAISDCEACLKLEPTNLKARLRLAESNYAYGRRRESYQLYINVLQLDPENAVALKATTELRKQFEDLPPPNATRLQIIDEGSLKDSEVKKIPSNQNTIKEIKAKTTTITTNVSSKASSNESNSKKNYDLAELIKPNRIVKNKIIKAAETLGKLQTISTTKSEQKNSRKCSENNSKKLENGQIKPNEKSEIIPSLRIPGPSIGKSSSQVKILIEEI